MILYTLVPHFTAHLTGLPLVLKDSLGIGGVPEAVAMRCGANAGKIASPGKGVHQGASSMYCRLKLIIDPRLGLGGWGTWAQELKGCLDQDGERHHSVERAGQHVFGDMCSGEPLEL